VGFVCHDYPGIGYNGASGATPVLVHRSVDSENDHVVAIPTKSRARRLSVALLRSIYCRKAALHSHTEPG
jgi:hypothetical protein